MVEPASAQGATAAVSPPGADAEDVAIIREVLAVQHVPVITTLHWEKLQTILRSLCDRIAIQGSRLDKAEEVGKNLASLRSDVDQLNKQAANDAAKDSKESEDQKNWAKMLEDRLAGLERGLEANTNNVKQLGDNVAVFKNIDISQLQSLPPRVDALEHFMEDSKHFMEETKHFMDDTRHFMDDTKHFIEDSKNFMDDTKHFMEDTKHFMDESTHFMEATKHFMEDSQHFMEDTKNFMDDADKDRQEREERERADKERERAEKERLDKERLDKERADALKAGLPPPPPPPPPPPAVEVPKAPESPKRRSSYVPDLATIQILKDKLEALGVDFKAQSEKVTNLQSQYDQLKELLQQTHKANSLDLEALQKALRTLRSDFDSKPFLDLNLAGIKSGDKTAPSGDLSSLEAVVADLQRRIQRKADSDDVEQLLRASDVTREDIARLQANLEELRDSLKRGSVSSVAAIDELKMQIKRNSVLAAPEISRRGSVVSDRMEKRCKKIEDDLAALEAKLADKVDSSMLDELRFKVTVVEGKQAAEAAKPQPAPRRDSESILIRLKELISNKVDRDEFLQLHVLLESKSGTGGGKTEKGGEEGLELELQGQRSETMKNAAAAAQLLHAQSRDSEGKYTELRADLDKLMREMQGLSERSDLAVLLARRADNLVQPVASLPDGTGRTGPPQDDEAIAKVINDHADRITEYSDMLLQMETLMSGKADMAGLQALKAAIIDLQKRKQSRMSGVPNLQQLKQPETTIETIKEMVVSEETTETIKKHDMILAQLAKNVELLNQATMTMSGHDLPQMMLDGDFGNFPIGQEEAAGERRSSVRFHGDQNEGQMGVGVRPATAPTYDFHAGNSGNGPAISRPATATISRPASAPNGKGSGLTTSMGDKFPEDFEPSLVNESQEHVASPPSRLSHLMQDTDDQQFDSEAHDLGSDSAPEDYENYAAIKALEDALRAHKIEPKENISKLVKWAREIQRLAADLNMLRTFMQDGLALKCDKSEHQRLAKLVKDFIARMDGEKAMLSGKPLIGFRCISCDHPLEKLLQGRADHLPTNLMPKNCLPMLSAERIFGRERREDSPPRSPPTGDYTRAVSKKNGYDPAKERKPAAANLRRVSSAGQTKRPQQPRQEI